MVVAVAEIKKMYLVIAKAAEAVILIAQVQQAGSLDKFVLSLCAEIVLAVLLSATFWQVIFVMPLKKARLANIEAATFLLSSGNLFDCAFFVFVFFLFGYRGRVLTLHFYRRCLLICQVFLLFRIFLEETLKSKYATISD